MRPLCSPPSIFTHGTSVSTGAWLFAAALVLLLHGLSVPVHGSEAAPREGMEARRSLMRERQQAARELQSVLESGIGGEEKRAAVAAFRSEQRTLRDQMEAARPEPVAQDKADKATQRARMAAHVNSMPEGPRKEMLAARLEFVEALEVFQEEAEVLSAEERRERRERRERLDRIRTERRQSMEGARAALEAEMGERETVQSTDPFHQALEAEQAKLRAALEDGSNEERREAVGDFREAVNQLREERRQRMEERREQEMPAREPPGAREEEFR